MNFVGQTINSPVGKTYGSVNSRITLNQYRKLAQASGFSVILEDDITANTLPTYPVVKRIFGEMGGKVDETATAQVELISRLGLLRYLVLGFQSV